jgi:hypothetical protein
MIFARVHTLLLIALFILVSTTIPNGARAEPGYQWEVKMEMSGMPGGFSMPAHRTCVPKARPDTPGMDAKECQPIESKKSGSHYYWKARCKDDNVVTGDFTYLGEAAYNGTITTSGRDGEMQMKVSGKRLGSCDYSNPSAHVAAMKAQTDRNMAAMCDAAIDRLDPSTIFGNPPLCPDSKKAFCDRLNSASTAEDLEAVLKRVESEREMARMSPQFQSPMNAAFTHCGLSYDTVLARLCHNAVSEKKYDLIGARCPAEKAKLGREYCEGRDYSALMASPDRDMCFALGSKNRPNSSTSGRGPSAGLPEPAPAPQEAPKEDPISSGINKLKGMFGF